MTEKTITPEDVRVGDHIRIEWMVDDILRAETGTVAEIDKNGGLMSKGEWFIGPSFIKARIRNGEQITLTLLDRPKLKLPTGVGSVIHVSECRGVKCDTLAMFDYDRYLHTPVPVAGHSFHVPSDITAWEPRNVVEVEK